MKQFFSLFFIYLAVSTFPGLHAQSLQEEKDLKQDWLVYEHDQYTPYTGDGNTNTIYLRIDSREHSNDFIRIRSSESFNVMVNGLVCGSGNHFQFPIDSLAKAHNTTILLFAINQDDLHARSIHTKMLGLSEKNEVDHAIAKRDMSSFRDFAISAALLLIVMLLVIIRLNPKLAGDYLSVTRIFSLREGEDAQMYSRIANSTNILFYVYCSLLIGYYLIVVFHFVSDLFPIALAFEAESFSGMILQWLKLSSMILSLLFVKIILVFGLSYLFGIGEIPGIHFFNWIRVLVVFFGLLSIVLFIYFIWHGHSHETHTIFLKLLGWIVGGWMILIFFKLSRRANASMFHLFSYICATELIPLLITIKVLFH